MKLYIKQKVFSFVDRFTVKDEYGNDVYYVEGELLTIGRKLHVYDKNNIEVAFIKQKVWNIMPKFEIYINNRFVTEIIKNFTLLSQSYRFSSLSWIVEGNFIAHDYTILDNGRAIMTIRKAWFSWGDSYELDIANDIDEKLALSIVLAIDCAMASSN